MQRLCIPLVALGLVGCDGRTDEDKVFDGVVTASDRVFAEIEADQSTWLVTVDEGSEIKGTVDNGIGGALEVVGWRAGAEHQADHGYHLAFSEKLFVSFGNWPEENIIMNGTLTITRHSLDFGPPDGVVEDASRMTSYRGAITTAGDTTGSFDLDVHAQASGNVLWTCGLINDQEAEHGACF